MTSSPGSSVMADARFLLLATACQPWLHAARPTAVLPQGLDPRRCSVHGHPGVVDTNPGPSLCESLLESAICHASTSLASAHHMAMPAVHGEPQRALHCRAGAIARAQHSRCPSDRARASQLPAVCPGSQQPGFKGSLWERPSGHGGLHLSTQAPKDLVKTQGAVLKIQGAVYARALFKLQAHSLRTSGHVNGSGELGAKICQCPISTSAENLQP